MISSSNKPFVIPIDLALAGMLRHELELRGYEMTTPNYTLFNAKGKGVSCTLYTSGKLVIQGKEVRSFVEFFLEPEILQTTSRSSQCDLEQRIGSDESGKGDFFGPLCVGAVCAEGEGVTKLFTLGVCDSKALSDAAILKLAPQIEHCSAHATVTIFPKRYNELYKSFGNLNHLLAWAHVAAIEQLVLQTGCRRALLDQFASSERVMTNALQYRHLDIALTQRPRAEEDVVVAAASILARYAFIRGLDKLSRDFGMTLPKGASAHVIAAGRQFVRQYGREALADIAKIHFKTTDTIIS